MIINSNGTDVSVAVAAATGLAIRVMETGVMDSLTRARFYRKLQELTLSVDRGRALSV